MFVNLLPCCLCTQTKKPPALQFPVAILVRGCNTERGTRTPTRARCNFTKRRHKPRRAPARKLHVRHNVILEFINWLGYENLERLLLLLKVRGLQRGRVRGRGNGTTDSLQFSISRTLCTDNRNFFLSSSCCCWSCLRFSLLRCVY